MSKILSEDEISALLSNVPEDEAGEAVKAPGDKKIADYDFRKPSLISKEQMRLLENIHAGLCNKLSVYLSTQLKMTVEMNMLSIDQISYSEFNLAIAPPGTIYVCSADNPATKFILEMNSQLSIFMVERLLGGRGEFIADVRPISVIEQKIMGRIVNQMLEELSDNWAPVRRFICKIDRFEINPEFVQIASTSDPVVVVSTEVKIQNKSSLLNICYPYIWVEQLVSTPGAQERVLFGTAQASEEDLSLAKNNLHGTEVTLRTLLGHGKINLGDFISLKEGDVIQLQSATDDYVPVYVQNKHMFDSVIGIRKQRYAIQIVTVSQGEKNDDH